jgi:hypothetical protein
MDDKRRSLLVALAIGLVSGPVLALAASGVFNTDGAVASPTTLAAAVAAPAALPTGQGAADTAFADLLAACGTEGRGLVAGETAGSLTALQQAALDALRPVCAAAGLSLDGPAPAAVIASGPSAAPAPGAGLPASGVAYDDGRRDDDRVGGDEYEDDRYEDESGAGEVEG